MSVPRKKRNRETKTRLSSLTRKDFLELVLNFLTTTRRLANDGRRVGRVNVFCLQLMALFIVCAIDVIDWFDFYKFEVSQNTMSSEYQMRLKQVYIVICFSRNKVFLIYEWDRKVADEEDVMMTNFPHFSFKSNFVQFRKSNATGWNDFLKSSRGIKCIENQFQSFA